MNDINAPRRPTPVPTAFDTWAVLDFWLRRWGWLAIWTVVLAIAGGLAARYVWKTTYWSSAQLIRYAPSAVDDAYHPRDIATPSLVLMLQSPRFFEDVGKTMNPQMSAAELDARITMELNRDGEVVTVHGEAPSPAEAVSLVNQFTAAAVAYTQKMQKDEAAAALAMVDRQLKEVENDTVSTMKVPAATATAVAAAEAAASANVEAAPIALPSNTPELLMTARQRLVELQSSFTEVHPEVQRQKLKVDALERQLKSEPTSSRNRAPVGSMVSVYNRLTPEETAVGERLRSNEEQRGRLAAEQSAIKPFAENPPGYFRIFQDAAESNVVVNTHKLEVIVWSCLAGFLGLIASAGQILVSEFADNRVKTRADVRRVTGLPVLATLGDLKSLTQAGRDQWAFRAWTALQSRLSLSPNHGMICGITSARPGEGRSTWVELLSRAASNCGFRVLTVTAQPTAEMADELKREQKKHDIKYGGFMRARAERAAAKAAELAPATTTTGTKEDGVALTSSVLSSPGQIVDRLAATDAPPVVNIPLPGWVWNLERRKQWQAALEAWRSIENVVIFVELPPASVPETVLLAENIPNLLWLSDSSSSDAGETQTELATLRDARCNLVGAVLNREPMVPIRGRFSRWFGASGFLIALGLMIQPSPQLSAAETPAAAPAVATAASTANFSIVQPTQRASWQQKLTLGPGDVLSFHIFGEPTLSREEVPIAPDGRISYLEAENIMAAGRTVDELREALNTELGRFRRAPQAYITPVAYNSKKYYVLGAVGQKGVFPLNRPITVIEAVALARGFETGMSQGTLTDSADFSKAFLGRGDGKVPVDFEKLFLHGDLSQNVALEPNDYLYFPPAGGGDIYVLGEVFQPGSVPFEPGASVVSAIASRGGFNSRAWRQRVLVVRGSLTNPEAIRVDVAGAFAGHATNIALKPGDLIFVNNRPWSKVEELIDRAASAFIEASVVGWTTRHIGPSNSNTTPVLIP